MNGDVNLCLLNVIIKMIYLNSDGNICYIDDMHERWCECQSVDIIIMMIYMVGWNYCEVFKMLNM